MERIKIFNILTSIFRKVLNDDTLHLTDHLTANDVTNWDSLSHMLLITEIEKCFSIKFRLKDMNKMRNVGEMVDIINSKL